MTIGEVSERSGLPPKTIRYYEAIGLVRPERSDNNYRAFREADVHALRFLGRARALGFPVERCRALLALWADRNRASAEVKVIAATHLAEIESKISELQAMRATLARLVEACAGDDRPDCPILGSLEPDGPGGD